MTIAATSSTEPAIGSDVRVLDTPAVLVDLDILERNVGRMAAAAADLGVSLRPHVKTHKTVGIARRQVRAGAAGLTVAKLDEAEAFLESGVLDLFVANEVVGPAKWARLARLQRRGHVSVGLDDLEVARSIASVARQEDVVVPVLIEIDSGLGRAGLPPGRPVLELARQIADLPGLHFLGVFTHAGHAYAAASPAEVAAIGRAEGEQAVDTALLLRRHGIACDVVSVGSTPTALHAAAVAGVTEIRPGNYVFYDRMQLALGSAQLADCALSVLVSVISRPTADRAVVDAGSKTFALDRGAHGHSAVEGYGETSAGGLRLERLSEEHGIVPVSDVRVRVGDRLAFLPNHACTAANLAEVLIGVRGGRVAELLPVLVRGGGR